VRDEVVRKAMISWDMTDRVMGRINYPSRILAPLLMSSSKVRHDGRRRRSSTTLHVNLLPVGFHAAAYATVLLPQCG